MAVPKQSSASLPLLANSKSLAMTANGNSTELLWPGGEVQYTVRGTFGGGSVKPQFSVDDAGTDWHDVPDQTDVTAAGSLRTFRLMRMRLRFVLSGATSPSIEIVAGRTTPSPY